jgi:outer membrane immunogenic protein
VKRKLLSILAVTFAAVGAQAALAADMALKAPVPPAPTAGYNWAGWYAGGNIGYGWGTASDPNLSFFDPAGIGFINFASYFGAGGNVTPDPKPRGVIGGGQIGYNWTLTPQWVGGLVADFQGSGIRGSQINTVTPTGFVTSNQTNSEQIDWFGTVRAKLGYAQNNWLLYGTGGLAYGRVATSGSFVAPTAGLNFTGSNNTTKIGWAAGAGLDYGLTSNWIVGVEYLYVDLGHVSYIEAQPALTPSSLTITNRAAAQIVRASLDYKF